MKYSMKSLAIYSTALLLCSGVVYVFKDAVGMNYVGVEIHDIPRVFNTESADLNEYCWTDSRNAFQQMVVTWRRHLGFKQTINMSVIELATKMQAVVKNHERFNRVPDDVSDYSYTISEGKRITTFIKDQPPVQKLYIHETYKGLRTIGGANFHILVHGKTNDTYNACWTRDFWNGTYGVCCPLLEKHLILEVILLQVNFSAYIGTYDCVLTLT